MTEPPRWPDDTLDLIFLPRFVEKIGFRAFADWTGTEATMEQQVVLLPQMAAANCYHRKYAARLLLKYRPDIKPWPYLDFVSDLREHKDWPIAQRLAEQLHKEAAPALHRLRSVTDEIIRQSYAGELTLKIRRVSGGPWVDYQPVWRNIDRPVDRFGSCTIDPEYPFVRRPSWMGKDDHWIFAPREGIGQVVARLAASPNVIHSPEKEPSASAVDMPAAASSIESPAVLPAGVIKNAQSSSAAAELAAARMPGAEAGPASVHAEVPVVLPEVNPGGRPTDRDRIVEEARRRLSAKNAKENVRPRLAPFCRDLRDWLKKQPDPELNSKTGEVMSVDTIEVHVRKIFWEFWERENG
jgi:hypothetical protein